jgi:FkbM family methyltransferase
MSAPEKTSRENAAPPPLPPSGLRRLVRTGLSQATKNRIGAVLCHPLVGRALATLSGDRIRSGALRIRTSHPSISPRTKAQIFWGIYESAEIRFVERHLRSDLDVLEVGSSLGVVSSHARSRQGASGRMVCVEANPDLIATIEANLAANCPGRAFTVLNRALDYEHPGGKTRLRLSGDTSESQLGRLSRSGDGASGVVREVEVPSTTIASLVRESGLRDYALISDVEGAEAGFVFADRAELDGCRQIIIELHDTEHAGRRLRWQDLRDALVARFGFRVVEGFGPVQVLER